MKILGFKITRQNKEDLETLRIFKKTVITLDKHARSLVKQFTGQINANIDTLSNILGQVELLRAYVSLYMDNKFSSPSDAFKIDHEMNVLFQNITKFVGLMTDFIAIDGKLRQNDSSEDDEKHMCDMMNNLVVKMNEHMGISIVALHSIIFTIRYDTVRVNMNIDILDEYKKRQKMELSESRTMFTVRFSKLNKQQISQQKGDVDNEQLKSKRVGNHGV